MKIAVVGLGVMGRNHKRVLEQLGHQVVTVDLAGHADLTDISRVRADGAVLSVPASQMHHFRDLDMPVLLLEKPGALSVDDLRHFWRSSIPMGYVERHNPAVIALKEQLPRVGEVLDVTTRRLGPIGRDDLDPALDLATHDLDTLRFLGFEQWQLQAQHSTRSLIGGHISALTNIGSLQVSHSYPVKVRTLEILGTEGVLQLNYQRQIVDFVRPELREPIPVRYEEPLKRMWKAILNGEPTATVKDGIEALRLATQLKGDEPEPAASALALAA